MSQARDLQRLLDALAAIAAERVPLPPALRERGGPLGPQVADRLEAGDDVPRALAGLLTPAERDLLAGPWPDLASAALLVAEDLRLRRERRWAWAELLVRPLVSLVVVLGYVLVAAQGLALDLSIAWLVVAGGTLLVVIVTVLLAEAPRLRGMLPTLGARANHAAAATRYERAALVATWQLEEARLGPWLGEDLLRLAPILARPDAAEHCRRLARWHREAAVRAHRRLGHLLATALALVAGALLLAVASPGAEFLLRQVAIP